MRVLLRVFALILVVGLLGGLVVFLRPLWVTDQVIHYKLWRQGVHSSYVQVDGYRVHYLEAGPAGGGGTPLVLIHGLESRSEDWAGLIPGLTAQGFHVYVPDLLGYGRSAKPDVEYSISLQVKTVADFMGTVGVNRANVCGWSMGGWVALQLALDDPALVNRVVVFDSAGIYFIPQFNADTFAPNNQAELLALTKMLTPHARPMPAFVGRGAIRKLRRDHWVVARSLGSMEAGKDLLDKRLGGLREPALIMWGKQDDLIPLAVGEAMHAKIPGSSLIEVSGCGHLGPAECSRPYLRGMVDFLRAEPAWHDVERVVPGK